MDKSRVKHGFSLARLWELDPAAIGGWKGKGVQLLQFLGFAGNNFHANNCLLRATALSYTTLLSLVPMLALAFSVLKGLGVQNKLAPLILQQVTAGSEVVVNRVVAYIGNTNMGSVGAIGLAALLYTSISMLGSVEEAFNMVWGVTDTRSFYRKFSDYLSVLVSAPLLLLAATSITTSLESQAVVGWVLERTYLGDLFLSLLSLGRYLIIWAALFLLYILIPNTRVRLSSALVGAVLAGTLWAVAQWSYIHFQVGASKYNAIYGTLAALPILMVWIYTSWVIVLFGMEVVAAHQNFATFRHDIRGAGVSQRFKEELALAALRHIALAFHLGERSWAEEQLARRVGVPLRLMRDTLTQLKEAGFLVQAAGTGGGLFPARELDQIPLSEVIFALRSRGASCGPDDEQKARAVVEAADQAVSRALDGQTLKQLATEEAPRR